MEKIVRALGSVFVRVVYRIVPSEYTFGTHILPHPREPTTFRFDPRRPLRHFRRDCRKDHDKVISYFRESLSLSFSVLPVLEVSVIDGPWRTYRLLTRSQNYSDSML